MFFLEKKITWSHIKEVGWSKDTQTLTPKIVEGEGTGWSPSPPVKFFPAMFLLNVTMLLRFSAAVSGSGFIISLKILFTRKKIDTFLMLSPSKITIYFGIGFCLKKIEVENIDVLKFIQDYQYFFTDSQKKSLHKWPQSLRI